MKVLLSCAYNPAFEALPEYLVAACRRLGHRTVLFDHRAYLLPGRIRSRLRSLDRLDRQRLNRKFVKLVRTERPDVVVVNQGTVIQPRSIESARDLGARCVNWFSDYPAEFERGLEMAPSYDAFYLGSSYAALHHVERGVRHAGWLPFACDPEIHRPSTASADDRETVRVPPVVFVGSHYPERQILLRFLRGLPVGVWGPGWDRAAGDPHIAPMIRGGAVRPYQWRKLFASARVVLNIHYGAFGPPEASGDLANTRVFEILGCGACQVVNRQGDVMRLFREGEHLEAFSSGEELRAKVEMILGDGDRAARIARNGRSEVLSAHTYDHRVRVLVEARVSPFSLPEGAHREAVETPSDPMAAGGAGR